MRDEGSLPTGQLETAHAIVEERLATLRFPIDKKKAIASVGDAPLPLMSGFRLGDILQGLPEKAFSDPFRAARATDERLDRIGKALAVVERAERGER